jgi:hypothetical protein
LYLVDINSRTRASTMPTVCPTAAPYVHGIGQGYVEPSDHRIKQKTPLPARFSHLPRAFPIQRHHHCSHPCSHTRRNARVQCKNLFGRLRPKEPRTRINDLGARIAGIAHAKNHGTYSTSHSSLLHSEPLHPCKSAIGSVARTETYRLHRKVLSTLLNIPTMRQCVAKCFHRALQNGFLLKNRCSKKHCKNMQGN